MKQANKYGKIILIITILILLTSCWDQNEIDRRAYVVAIGMDKGEEEGIINITLVISNPEFGTQLEGGSTNEAPYEIISFATNDLIIARNTANSVIARYVSYDILRNLFISEELARDKNFIRYIYDLTKDREIRRDIRFTVTKESAFQFLTNNHPKLETRPHKYFDYIIERDINTGIIPDAFLIEFFRITEADADLFQGIYATTEVDQDADTGKNEDNYKAGQFYFKGETNSTNFFGSAVFKEGQMIGTMTGQETRLSILLNKTLQAPDVVADIPDPYNDEYQITVRINNHNKTKVKMDLTKARPTVDVNVPIVIEVLTDHSMTNYASSQEKRNRLKEHVKENVTKKIEELVKKTQEEFKAEPFGWSLIARKKFRTIKEYENFDWMKTYPDMEVNITVDVQLGDFGRQSELPKLKEVRD